MSVSTHEAVLGGARWRLTLHPDGRWDVARRVGLIWDDVFAGTGGLPAVREANETLAELRKQEVTSGLITIGAWAGCDVLTTLADVAERNTT